MTPEYSFKTKPNLYSKFYFAAHLHYPVQHDGAMYYCRSLKFERNFHSCAEAGALVHAELNGILRDSVGYEEYVLF